MRFLFIVEDHFGEQFFPKFFDKKSDGGFFHGRLVRTRRVPLNSKITRTIKVNIGKVDRIIIISDAEGGPLESKKNTILQYIQKEHLPLVRVVLFDYEIEDWICYSLGIKFGNSKPSDILKQKIQYEKNQLPEFVDRLDCKILQNHQSFQNLVESLRA